MPKYYSNYFDTVAFAFNDGLFREDPNGLQFGFYEGPGYDQAINVEPKAPQLFW